MIINQTGHIYYVCDSFSCQALCKQGVDGYPTENGWATIYRDHRANEPTEHFCPKCVEHGIEKGEK